MCGKVPDINEMLISEFVSDMKCKGIQLSRILSTLDSEFGYNRDIRKMAVDIYNTQIECRNY